MPVIEELLSLFQHGHSRSVADATKADVPMTKVHDRHLAVCDPQVAGDVVKGTTLHNLSSWFNGRLVFDPLPYIAKHVIESVAVWPFEANVMRGIVAVGVVPGDGIERAVTRVWSPAGGGKFPLGLGWEPHANRVAV